MLHALLTAGLALGAIATSSIEETDIPPESMGSAPRVRCVAYEYATEDPLPKWRADVEPCLEGLQGSGWEHNGLTLSCSYSIFGDISDSSWGEQFTFSLKNEAARAQVTFRAPFKTQFFSLTNGDRHFAVGCETME